MWRCSYGARFPLVCDARGYSCHLHGCSDNQHHASAMTKSSRDRTVRFQVWLAKSELQAIDEFRFRLRLPTRAAAVRALMQSGMRSTDTGDRSDNGKARNWGGLPSESFGLLSHCAPLASDFLVVSTGALVVNLPRLLFGLFGSAPAVVWSGGHSGVLANVWQRYTGP